MKVLSVAVMSCSECDFFDWVDDKDLNLYPYCGKKRIPIELPYSDLAKDNTFPAWCPLPDYKES